MPDHRATSEGGTGVLLLHGKWDAPPGALAPLEDTLRVAGLEARCPPLPWARTRLYDRDLDGAVSEIHATAQAMRAAGCHRLVLAGHSLGALAGLLAAPSLQPDGVVVMSPGHFCDELATAGLTTQSLASARAALNSAHLAERTQRQPLTDVFLGAPRRLRLPPATYLSYFDPDGRANWRRALRAWSTAVPLCWVTGRRDPHAARGPSYAYALAPAHTASCYLEVDADHLDAPAVAATRITDWILGLPPT